MTHIVKLEGLLKLPEKFELRNVTLRPGWELSIDAGSGDNHVTLDLWMQKADVGGGFKYIKFRLQGDLESEEFPLYPFIEGKTIDLASFLRPQTSLDDTGIDNSTWRSEVLDQIATSEEASLMVEFDGSKLVAVFTIGQHRLEGEMPLDEAVKVFELK